MQKRDRTLSRKGRQEKNKPRISMGELLNHLTDVMWRPPYQMSFDLDTTGSEVLRCLDFYKALLVVAPALVISEGRSLSIYGFGSFIPRMDSKGRYSVRFKPSPSLSTTSNNSYKEVFDNLLRAGRDKKDKSVLEVSYEY